MQKQVVTIVNKLGLHARASAKLTQAAAKYPCGVFIARNGKRVNAKSIMGVMMLAAGMGSTVEIETDGPEEDQAMATLVRLIGEKFGEGE